MEKSKWASRRDAARLARGFNPGIGKKSEASPVGTTEIWSEVSTTVLSIQASSPDLTR